MYSFLFFWILFGTPSATNDFIPPPGDVCSGDRVTFSCSRDDSLLEWTYNFVRVVIFDDRNSPGTDTYLVDGITFTVALIFLNNTFTTSNISFTANPAADGKVLACTGPGITSKTTIHVVTDAPVVTDVNSAEVIYDANSLRLTLQFTVINGSGTPTLNVLPPAASLGSVQNTSSSTFSADITLLYNANYTLTITDINCAGQERQHINFLRVNCSIPNEAAGVRLWPFTDTTEGATITYSCSDGYLPQTNRTSQCAQAGGVWLPDPALSCSIVCSVPPSFLAVPVQANDSHPYVEGDMAIFQCISGLTPADVMIATCTMEGSWRPDPQLLTCSSPTEDTAIMSGQVIFGVCFFLLGLLCGVAAGVSAVIVYFKCSRNKHPPPSQSPPLAPLYDDIELPTTTKHEVELEHNVAYAHLN